MNAGDTLFLLTERALQNTMRTGVHSHAVWIIIIMIWIIFDQLAARNLFIRSDVSVFSCFAFRLYLLGLYK